MEREIQEGVAQWRDLTMEAARLSRGCIEELTRMVAADHPGWSTKNIFLAVEKFANLPIGLMAGDDIDAGIKAGIEWCRRKAARRAAKARAAIMGLAYWPALLSKCRINPAAYLVAEAEMIRLGLGIWGEDSSRGGWDVRSHYGISGDEVACAWYAAGCKDSPKFRTIIRFWALSRAEKPGCWLVRVPASYGAVKTAHLLKGARWAEANRISVSLTRQALQALGRLSAPLRWAAMDGVSAGAGAGQIRLRDLNWPAVADVQQRRKVQRVKYSPLRLQWQVVVGEDCPRGVSLAPWQVSAKLHRQLRVLAQQDSAGVEINPALAALAALFRSVQQVAQFAGLAAGDPIDVVRRKLHDAGQFALPAANARWSRAAWADLCLKHGGEMARLVVKAPFVEAELGRMPRGLVEAREVAGAFLFEGVEAAMDRRVAKAAAVAGLTQAGFEAYRNLMREAEARPKLAEYVPSISVTGADIGVVGDWVMRRLDCDDPVGPMLGLLTNCCQHLGNAAASCARDGVLNPKSSFFVVEYRGKVIAQSWAWRAQESIVFDSIEGLSSAYVKVIAALYKKAAEKMMGVLGVSRVLVGQTEYGLTPYVQEIIAPEVSKPAPAGCPSGCYSDARSVWGLA